MSTNTSTETGESGSNDREVAYRLFAAECNDASYSYSESGEERAPNYVVTPTGARVNRLFAVGVLTELSQASESMLRARVVDPTGAFVVYAGQYQPDAMRFLDSVEPPAFVAVTGKLRTFQPDDADVVYTSIRPEEISEVDSDTRDRWTVSTAERTLERVATIAAALDTGQTGDELRESLRESEIAPSFAAGIPIAIEQYGTTPAYLEDVQRLALDATRLVADGIEIVESLKLAPDEGENRNENGTVEPVIDVDSDEFSIDETAPTKPTTNSDRTTQTTSLSTPSAASTTESEHETNIEQQSPTAEAESTETHDSRDENGAASADTETDEVTGTETETETETVDEFDPDEFELDDDVRQEIESEYGTDFSTAAEVDAPGEAGIETNEPERAAESTEETDIDTATDIDTDESAIETETETETETEIETDADADTSTEADADSEDIESLLLEQMRDLDGGDGANREELIDRVIETAGVSREAVEDAIQDVLMSGQCYEPDDGTLKPI